MCRAAGALGFNIPSAPTSRLLSYTPLGPAGTHGAFMAPGSWLHNTDFQVDAELTKTSCCSVSSTVEASIQGS